MDSPRKELLRLISLYVLKQNRTEVLEAVERYMKYRDLQLEYFIPVPAGPFKTEWERIEG